MRFPGGLHRLLHLRRTLRTLERIALAQERQADALDRLCIALGAVPQVEASATDLQQTGVSVSRDREQAALQDFAARFLHDTHREPTDEELAEALDTLSAGRT